VTGSSNPDGRHIVFFITKQPTLIWLKITQIYFNSTGYTRSIQRKYGFRVDMPEDGVSTGLHVNM
jgi:hypothetical protein